MLKFKFRLETLKTHRKRLLEEAQREYQKAQRQVDDVHDQIEKMYNQIDDSRARISAEETNPASSSISTVNLGNEYIEHLKIKIQTKRMELRELMAVAEEKHEAMVQASLEFKILEKLREKKFEEFKKEMKRREVKEMDDLTSMRHRRAR